ncbi:MAG: hypothetical protein RLZZ416_163 [Candidatus Parcubacteria bacterium]|jgi:hypothetical protein
MATSYEEYRDRIITLHDYPTVIDEARREYEVATVQALPVTGLDVPFLLEREYADALIDRGEAEMARRVIERMKLSYPIRTAQDLVRSLEYRLSTMQKIDARITATLEQARREAREDMNQHTILLVALTAGIIAIFGAATAIFRASSYDEAWMTFMGVSFAVIMLVFVAFACNYLFRGRK